MEEGVRRLSFDVAGNGKKGPQVPLGSYISRQ
jgi:hypothetical protein